MILEAIQFPNIDPAAFTIPGFDLFGGHWGPFPLRWYALAYIVGLVLGWRWMVWLIRRDKLWAPNKPALSVPQADDFLFWATLGVILGGRIGYVLFYKPDMIWRNFMEVFQIWQGGMSFHGGLIGVAVAAWWFTRQTHVNEEQYAKLAAKHAVDKAPEGKEREYARFGEDKWILKTEAEAARVKAKTDKVDLLRLGDIAAAAAPIGLFFGRIANFINGELWGRVADPSLPWAMVFRGAGSSPRHPSQIYQFLMEGLLLFVLLWLYGRKERAPGQVAAAFLTGYGVFRFIAEYFREPDAHLGLLSLGMSMGQWLSLPMILAGAGLWWWFGQRAPLAGRISA